MFPLFLKFSVGICYNRQKSHWKTMAKLFHSFIKAKLTQGFVFLYWIDFYSSYFFYFFQRKSQVFIPLKPFKCQTKLKQLYFFRPVANRQHCLFFTAQQRNNRAGRKVCLDVSMSAFLKRKKKSINSHRNAEQRLQKNVYCSVSPNKMKPQVKLRNFLESRTVNIYIYVYIYTVNIYRHIY